MGANLVDGGATFHVWAPRARKVYVQRRLQQLDALDDSSLLSPTRMATWTGFMPGAKDGHNTSSTSSATATGYKRDPYARELTNDWPTPDCILRCRNLSPWQDWSWRTPDFRDLIVYQFHVGTWYGPQREHRVAKFLDVLDRVEYLADLGVNAIEPLPIVEYSTPRSMGYNGSDLFSPEMDYQVADGELDRYLALATGCCRRKASAADARGARHRHQPVEGAGRHLPPLWHRRHSRRGLQPCLGRRRRAAGVDLLLRSRAGTDPNDSLYFTDQDHTGPVFAFWNADVRQFLIDNAKFFLDEYHVDGFRYDQVTVIDQQNAGSGWLFCQHLNATLDAVRSPRPSTSPSIGGPSRPSCEPRAKAAPAFTPNWHDGLRRRDPRRHRPGFGRAERRRRLAAGRRPASRPRLSGCLARRPVRREPRRGLSRPQPAEAVARGFGVVDTGLVCDEPIVIALC